MARPRKNAQDRADTAKGKTTTATPPNLTQDEAAIFQRIAGDTDKDWQTITEGDIEDYSLGENPFKLPEPAKKRLDAKEFAYRWVERTPARLDQVKYMQAPKRWWICNSTNTPYLEDFIDPILGCVCNLDQMLVFKPYWMHMENQRRKMELAENQSAQKDISNRDGKTVDDGKIEYRSGDNAKIGSGDEVVADVGLMDEMEGRSEPSGSEDLIVD